MSDAKSSIVTAEFYVSRSWDEARKEFMATMGKVYPDPPKVNGILKLEFKDEKKHIISARLQSPLKFVWENEAADKLCRHGQVTLLLPQGAVFTFGYDETIKKWKWVQDPWKSCSCAGACADPLLPHLTPGMMPCACARVIAQF